MAAKAMLALCALALSVQTALSQCLPLGGYGCGGFVPAASTGGSFVVTSSSPVAPTGISVVSNNLYEGTLIVEGDLPLLGSVGLEGTMGTAGAGTVSYGCGDGDIGIVAEEGPIVTGIASETAVAPGLIGGLGLGYGNGLYGLGYGLENGICGLGYGLENGIYGLGSGLGNGIYGLGCGLGNGIYGLGYGLGNGIYGLGYGLGNGLYGLGYGYGNGIYGLGGLGC